MYFTLAVRNIRYFQLLSFVVAWMLCGVMLLLFGVVQLTETATMQILGRFFPLLGFVLISPIIIHEFSDDISDVVCTKQVAYWKIVLVRFVTAILMVGMLYALYVGILAYNESEFLWTHVFYSFINLLFLGSLALLVMALTKNSTVGYMIAIIYYLMNFFISKQLGVFYLFQMQDMKWTLLFSACGCLMIGVFWISRKK